MNSKRFRCGLDEAGYGPKLGPLVVARTWLDCAVGGEGLGLEVENEAIERALSGYADSKRLYRPGHLRPLEIAALAARAVELGTVPKTLEEFLGGLPKGCVDYPWYAEAGAARLPLVASVEEVEDAAAGLQGRLEDECLILRSAQAVPLLVAAFNQQVKITDNKAAVEMDLLAELLLEPVTSGRSGAVRCDRLGGRMDYDSWISGQLPFWSVETLERTRDRSAYLAQSQHVSTQWEFLVKGEDRAPEIAMASCLAKYTREVFMHHFNRYWQQVAPAVAPTAGYPQDAGRWLREMEQQPMVREHLPRLVRLR